MACDTTHRRRALDAAIAGAARLANNPAECICDCEVVSEINRADHDRLADRQARQLPPVTPTRSQSK
jgi:hypothetical protein